MDFKIGYKALALSLFLSAGIVSAKYVTFIDAETIGGIAIEKENVEIGTIMMWGNTNPPEGWVMLDGGLTSNYPELKNIYGNNLPDLRGKFIRGYGGNSAGLGVTQIDSFKSHSHGASFTGNALPPHNHTLYTWNGNKEEHGYAGYMAKASSMTRYTSTVSAGTPTGTVNINSTGGIETRPENIALVYVIKAE